MPQDTTPEDLLDAALKGVIERSGIDPKLIEDVAVGNVLPPGSGATVARMASLHSGIPDTAGLNTVNRQCSSGLQTVVQIANAITTGQIDIGIGAGVESMTMGACSPSPISLTTQATALVSCPSPQIQLR